MLVVMRSRVTQPAPAVEQPVLRLPLRPLLLRSEAVQQAEQVLRLTVQGTGRA